MGKQPHARETPNIPLSSSGGAPLFRPVIKCLSAISTSSNSVLLTHDGMKHVL